MTLCVPIIPTVGFTTDHVTFGTLRGMRPSTSRSNNSTISGRRSFHHTSAVVTFYAARERQDVRQIREWIGFRLVVVGAVGCGLVAARSGTQAFDTQLRHHVLVIAGSRSVG